MNVLEGFKQLMANRIADTNLLVPMLIWCSGYERNIELVQSINKKFFKVDKSILMKELALGNKLTHFIKYPKVPKEDEKTKFFYGDICRYFGWTKNELDKNINVINIDELKEVIADNYGYDEKQRKILKLKRRKNVKKKKKKIIQTRII